MIEETGISTEHKVQNPNSANYQTRNPIEPSLTSLDQPYQEVSKILLALLPFYFYNNASNRQCNSTSSATELGFLSGSTAVFPIAEHLRFRRRGEGFIGGFH